VSSRQRIIVTGLVGLYPLGGVAWDYFQYVIGLARMGHDVYYHEDTWTWPYHPVENRNTAEGDFSARFIRDFFEAYAPELRDRWHYLHLHEKSFGMTREAFDEVARSADLFLNVSGDCFIPESLSPRCVKVFLDTDPGYNQIMLSERFAWSENVERWCSIVESHDRFLSNAENIGREGCLVPAVGLDWKPTGRPVVLDLWDPGRPQAPPPEAAWTTVMTWNNFKGRLVYEGVEYKSKGAEFERVMELPRQLEVPLQIALGGSSAPLERVARHGWQVVDAPEVTLTPARYQQFIAGSRGEFSTAKHVYVAMRTGWFSYRTACYLAGGRPAVVQDTGFSSLLPVGEGLLVFDTLEEAGEAIREVEGNYERHARAARELAEEYCDATTVLRQLLEDSLGTTS
jgi:hypothetical protein